MTDKSTFLIADIAIDLLDDTPLPDARKGPSYEGFDRPATSSARPQSHAAYTVNITREPCAIPADAREVFRTNSWSAYKSGPLTFLHVGDAVPDQYKWDVRMTQGEATLFAPGAKRQSHEMANNPRHPFSYPTDQIILFHMLHNFDAILMHSVGFVLGAVGIVAAGKSGAGKSTLASFIEPAGARVLSDDRIAVRCSDGQPTLYGTPWPGEGGHARNEGHPLSHLLFLVQSSENKIVPISPAAAAQRLMPVCSIPWYDETIVTACFNILDRIVRTVPCAELHFTRSDQVLHVLRDLKA